MIKQGQRAYKKLAALEVFPRLLMSFHHLRPRWHGRVQVCSGHHLGPPERPLIPRLSLKSGLTRPSSALRSQRSPLAFPACPCGEEGWGGVSPSVSGPSPGATEEREMEVNALKRPPNKGGAGSWGRLLSLDLLDRFPPSPPSVGARVESPAAFHGAGLSW